MIPLYDTLHSRRFPLVNWLLIGLNVLVFLYEMTLSPAALERLTRTWGLVPAQLMAHPASTLDHDLHCHVPARRLVPHPEQHVGAVHLRR